MVLVSRHAWRLTAAVAWLTVIAACSKTPPPLPTTPPQQDFAEDDGGLGDGSGDPGGDPGGTGGSDLPPDDSILSMRGDPAFRYDALSATEKLWYDRVEASIDHGWGTLTERAGSGDLYELGRNVGDATAALLMALRATGDLHFLDRVAELSDLYRADLADAWLDGTTDGYVNWLWLETPTDPAYGTDNHDMDEAMTHGNVAVVAYAFEVNRSLSPEYAARADFWRDYLVNDFLAKWTAREGGDRVAAWDRGFYKRFTHPRANQLRLAYFLWMLTGDGFYADRARDVAADLKSHCVLNPTVPSAYQWKHQVGGADEGWQKINYAQYYMRAVLEMHLQRYEPYASTAEVTRYMSTFRDVVFARVGAPYATMTLRVDGSEEDGTSVYGLSGFARWDGTGKLLAVADDNFSAGSYGLSTAAYALAAVSRR